jgi:hypothetical protein
MRGEAAGQRMRQGQAAGLEADAAQQDARFHHILQGRVGLAAIGGAQCRLAIAADGAVAGAGDEGGVHQHQRRVVWQAAGLGQAVLRVVQHDDTAGRRIGGGGIATSGIATTNHLAMEELAEREGAQLTHVPFRGSSEGMTAVLSGQVDCIADSSVWVPQVESGQMRALCVWTADRVPRLPGIPTLKELGYAMVITSPYGIYGPKGMDPAVVRVLHDAFKAALFSPANAAVRSQFDMPEQYLDTEQYTDFIAKRAEHERAMVQRLGIKLD